MTENGLRIIQSREVFSFSLDAVLLSKFASVPKRGRILDLCTGNGVIPFLLTTRTNAQIDGVEIQPRLAEMARRSNRLNGLEHQVNIMEGDLKEYVHTAGYGVYDAITVNPPYMQVTTGEQNENEHYAIARHEMLCTLEDVVEAAAKLVKSGGKVAMVHRPARLLDIVESMRRWKLEPKRLQFVHPRADGEANMVLIEAMRDGKPELRLLPPIIIYE
ncbi:tRNA1(Val) (adenine(37)-N6)-methyltransferase [Paenibacillus sp. GCM10023252]|uniref:tRNA1(Val) (adenine(37)-N6)-methyltransferase n=1 Tax=Paenibacillus sp. GCM10023252 TaxID=3252649 RepID=UPI0036173972